MSTRHGKPKGTKMTKKTRKLSHTESRNLIRKSRKHSKNL